MFGLVRSRKIGFGSWQASRFYMPFLLILIDLEKRRYKSANLHLLVVYYLFAWIAKAKWVCLEGSEESTWARSGTPRSIPTTSVWRFPSQLMRFMSTRWCSVPSFQPTTSSRECLFYKRACQKFAHLFHRQFWVAPIFLVWKHPLSNRGTFESRTSASR